MNNFYNIGYELGETARQDNFARIPMNDFRVRKMIKEECRNINFSMSLVNGWLEGFDSKSIEIMIGMVSERAAEIASNPDVQKKLVTMLREGRTEEELKNWVTLQAVATLFVPVEERRDMQV